MVTPFYKHVTLLCVFTPETLIYSNDVMLPLICLVTLIMHCYPFYIPCYPDMSCYPPCNKTGILRYKVDFQSLQLDEPLDDVDLDDY